MKGITIKLLNKDLDAVLLRLDIKDRGFRLSGSTLIALAELEAAIEDKKSIKDKACKAAYKANAKRAECDSADMKPVNPLKPSEGMVPSYKKGEEVIIAFSDEWYEYNNTIDEILNTEVVIEVGRKINIDDLYYNVYKEVGGKEVKERLCAVDTFLIRKLLPAFK